MRSIGKEAMKIFARSTRKAQVMPSRAYHCTRGATTTRSLTRMAEMKALKSAFSSKPGKLASLRSVQAAQIRPRVTVSAAATAEPETEEHQYQAEVDRMMDMIVHSLYSNREVFLRELVSNASDALDKIRFLSLTEKDVLKDEPALEIRVKSDPEAGTITVEDTGVGMTKEELVSSLGTIARSGTAKFAQAMKDAKKDANLIGQFGVGFYSSFLVSDRVLVQTKHNDDKQWRWESSAGAHSFKVVAENDGDLKRGTRVTMYLKEDAKELADDKKLGALIKQYSEFIQFPIRLWQSSVKNEQVVDEEATAKKKQEAIEAAKSKGEDESKVHVEDVKKSKSTTEWDWQLQNNNKPIWTRPTKEVDDEEYNAFYKATFKEFMDPVAHSHFNVEGTLEFSALLYIPGMAPFEEINMTQKSRNIKLFVKRVFISDEFDDNLLPRYLSFVKGIVDSSDLPLNVSREILQESRVVRTIKKQLTRRTLEMLEKLAKRPAKANADDPEGANSATDYELFFDSFGKFLKLGILDDEANRKQLSKLLRFETSKSNGQKVGLEEYVARMKEGQNDIYFLSAENTDNAESSPFVERLTKKGFEVVYLLEPVDEISITTLGEFDGRLFVDVSREGLNLGDEEEEKKKFETAAEDLKGLTDFMKEALGDKVEKVVVSSRLADSPCALVTSKHGWSAAQERLMKSQALGDNRAAEYMKGRKQLEINPDHLIVEGLNTHFSEDRQNAKEIIELLYETALVTSGFNVDSPKAFAERIYSMVGQVTAGTQLGSGSENGSSSEPIEPEVMENSSDPWKQ